MNELALDGMPFDSLLASLEPIRAAGYDGIQTKGDSIGAREAAACRELGLLIAGSGRVNTPEEVRVVAARLAEAGFVAATLHAGWGMEDDAAARSLIEAVIDSSERCGIPLYVETHRATIFQDMWRTAQFAGWYPELRFNGDFSHWYTGQEMVYGGFENKLQFIQPVLDRVRFLHGRIGNPGCIQVDIGDGSEEGRPFVGHFRALWTAAMTGFLRSAAPGDYLAFTPELLASGIYYEQPLEKSDRWQQSLVLCRIAKECFGQAQNPVTGLPLTSSRG